MAIWCPSSPAPGDGFRFHTTGLTHDERGYPMMTTECQEQCVRRLVDKIRGAADEIAHIDEDGTEDAEVVVISYGITSRVARMAIAMARERGVRTGSMRLVVVWPFPERAVSELAGRVAGLVVPELNYGQISLEVERLAAGRCPVWHVGHGGGTVHDPQTILEKILEAAKVAA